MPRWSITWEYQRTSSQEGRAIDHDGHVLDLSCTALSSYQSQPLPTSDPLKGAAHLENALLTRTRHQRQARRAKRVPLARQAGKLALLNRIASSQLRLNRLIVRQRVKRQAEVTGSIGSD